MTTPKRDGNHWRIDGRKKFITGATRPEVRTIMANIPRTACMFLVELPAPAIRIERVLDSIDSSTPNVRSMSMSRLVRLVEFPDAKLSELQIFQSTIPTY